MKNFRQRLLTWHMALERQMTLLEQPVVPPSTHVTALPPCDTAMTRALCGKVRAYVMAHFSGATVAPLDAELLPDTLVHMDVAFWVDGEIRASAIVSQPLPLPLALECGTRQALGDGRFRPLREAEIARLWIELTFFGPWHPLTIRERQQDAIDPESGYVAVVDGQSRAWYLPMVHNNRPFTSLRHLLDSLMRGKGQLSPQAIKRAVIYRFPTRGCLESPEHAYRQLAGPLVAAETTESVELMLDRSLEWLLRQEYAPGIWLPKRAPGSILTNAIDWPRIGFSALVLAEAGRAIGRDSLTQKAKCTVAALKPVLPIVTIIGREAQALTSVYAGLTAVAWGETEAARWWYREALRYQTFERFHPIGALLLTRLAVGVGEREQAKQWFEILWERWERDRDSIQLALYPELMVVAKALHVVTHEPIYLDRATRVGDWYVARQNEDGSFPFAPGSARAPYIRGMGKILEVLAVMPERYREPWEKGIQYVAQFQYTNINSYHVPRAQQAEFLGGFRHDVFNREAWIDAAGHVILALVRMRAFKETAHTRVE